MTNTKKIIILGAGGYAKTVADILQQNKTYTQISFLDDTKTGANILGKCSEYIKFKNENTDMYPAFGNNEVRAKWFKTLQQENINIPTIIHNSVYISPTVKIEKGTVVLPKAIINTNCVVKQGCIVNCGAIIDHDCVLEEFVHICIGAMVKAENKIPKGTKIEAGEIVARASLG
jgi:UDP-N-acetylbacillosamine N-acetyltransferase